MKKNKKIVWAMAYLGLILLCVLIIYVVPSVRGMLVRTYITEPGEIVLSNEADAYVVRDEKVYTAAESVKVDRLAEPGDLVKAYSTIVELSGEGVPSSAEVYTKILNNLGDSVKETDNGRTGMAGYVAYSVDGSEDALNPAVVEDIKKKELARLAGVESKDTAKGDVAKGDPLFRIVRNGKYYLIFYVDNETGERYNEGYGVTVNIDGKELKADIKYVKKGKNETRVVLKCGMFFDGYLTARKVHMTVTTSSGSGLMLENRSIVEKDGKQGVLVKNKLGKYIFTPVKVLTDDGKNCVVAADLYLDDEMQYVETISIYDEIVTSPGKKEIAEAE